MCQNVIFKKKRREYILRADNERDNGNSDQAAALYQIIIDRWGATPGLLMQYGNALKDSASFKQAENIYKQVWMSPHRNADVALQLGHLMKIQGNSVKALEWYNRSIDLDKSITNPAHIECKNLDRSSKEAEENRIKIEKINDEKQQNIPEVRHIPPPTDSLNLRDRIVLCQLYEQLKFRRI
ncbi:hypothetical protein E3E12_08750 (plasmid) [Formicincola oecophyllae]|uniref:Uncharacterized protein n=1 Tax=Formicincola oecophyllae TaxID=2558361 RepID=A0A5B9M5A4_9PROT|nr:hypothetical protein [Formicincola oecophyllae]QEF95969.1 hypothetical protein E3E12_08750 [Formicincola oecophyllae]